MHLRIPKVSSILLLLFVLLPNLRVQSKNLIGAKPNPQPEPLVAAAFSGSPGTQQLQDVASIVREKLISAAHPSTVSIPTVINYGSHQRDSIAKAQQVAASPTTNHQRVSYHQQHYPTVQQQHNSRLNNAHRHHNLVSNHYYVNPAHRFSVCHIPDNRLNQTRCRNTQEEEFKRTAMAEFQSRLGQTSEELQHLLSSHLTEFHSLSLGSVLVARRNTLSKLYDSRSQLASMLATAGQQQPGNNYRSWLTPASGANATIYISDATNRLFNSMWDYLDRFETSAAISVASPELVDTVNVSRNPRSVNTIVVSPYADIQHELSLYFRRLNLYFIKQKLELSHSNPVDLDCLDKNLERQTKLEDIQSELWAPGGSSDVLLDQARLHQSIKQSLEFARTLLSSLNFARSMFHNLTRHASDWMPQAACREALARMTVCSQCHATSLQQPAPSTAPCEPYCLNVVRGCMNDIYELNRFWSDHVSSLARFKSNMIQTNNIENVMSNLDDKIIQFIAKLSQQYNQTAATSANGKSTGSGPAPLGGHLAARVSYH